MRLDTRKTRVCTRCTREQYKEEFPEDKNICKQCDKEVRKQYAVNAQKKRLDARLSEFVAEIRGDKIDVPHICELASELVKKFNGVKGVAEQLYQRIMKAEQEKPGSKTSIDAMVSVVRLIEASTKLRPTAPDLSNMSDDDIRESLVRLVGTRTVDADYLLSRASTTSEN